MGKIYCITFAAPITEPKRNKIVRVTILQTDIEWIKPEHNRETASRLMAAAPRSDLYVLPEMWNTGFITEPALVEAGSGDFDHSLEWMRLMAERFGGAVCGSMAVREADGGFRNRFCFVRPDGSCSFYDKRHLFTYGGEDKHYESGNKRVTVSYGGLRMLLATCYDLRFPVWLRNTDGYDAIVIVANWPASRRKVWQTLLRARAVENQCFMIAANRTGCGHCGDSAVIDAKGNSLAEAEDETQQTITADLDLDSLYCFRRKFPVLGDRDSFDLLTE